MHFVVGFVKYLYEVLLCALKLKKLGATMPHASYFLGEDFGSYEIEK